MDHDDNPTGKPSLSCRANGPYFVDGLSEIQASDGSSIPVEPRTALCRCGASAKKPFCDGTHKRIGFDDAIAPDRTPVRQESYVGKTITIHDNRGLCAHAGVCTDRLPSVWRLKQEPWIDPDSADVAEIIEVVKACPSGALSYTMADAPAEQGSPPSTITIVKNGPYVVSGLLFPESLFAERSAANKLTLCRCGASKNKPFCDGSHWHVKFDEV